MICQRTDIVKTMAVAICCTLLTHSHAQLFPDRKYTAGEKFRYAITTEVTRNGQSSGKTISISEHTVMPMGNAFAEEVKWLGKTSINGRDTVCMDSLAGKVAPYILSLSPGATLHLPRLTVPGMTGEITDLHTFYVAVAPALHAQKLSPKKTSFTNAELRQGNFADSIEILYGTDCLQVTPKLVSSNKDYAVIETRFLPPPRLCLDPLLDTIKAKSFSQFNNIQFIRKSEGDKVNIFWGVETFTIVSKVSRSTGQILEATMDNQLTLKMRYNATPDLKTYAAEIPLTIRRTLQLELVKQQFSTMQQLTPIQKAERNKANYLAAKTAFNNKNLEACLSYYSPDHEVKSKPGSKGRAAIQQFLEETQQAWPDIQMTIEHAVAEGNWVMGRSVATATHSKPVLGVPPTGKKITAAFWDLHLFDDNGLIIETWNLMDNLAIMKQIGLL